MNIARPLLYSSDMFLPDSRCQHAMLRCGELRELANNFVSHRAAADPGLKKKQRLDAKARQSLGRIVRRLNQMPRDDILVNDVCMRLRESTTLTAVIIPARVCRDKKQRKAHAR